MYMNKTLVCSLLGLKCKINYLAERTNLYFLKTTQKQYRIFVKNICHTK